MKEEGERWEWCREMRGGKERKKEGRKERGGGGLQHVRNKKRETNIVKSQKYPSS